MVNPKAFYLARWNDKNGDEQVLVSLFSTMVHLYEIGAIPDHARMVEAAHPENLRMDTVFNVGTASSLGELIEESRRIVKIWGLFDHENCLQKKVDSNTQEAATQRLLEDLKFHSLPPMWRVLEVAL